MAPDTELPVRGIAWNRRSWGRVYLASIVGWTLLGIALGLNAWTTASDRNDHRSFADMMVLPIGRFEVFAALTPLVIYFATRYPIGRKHLARNLGLHILGFAVFSSAYVSLRLLIMPPFSPSTYQWMPRTPMSAIDILKTNYFEFFTTYIMIVAIGSWADLYLLSEHRRRHEEHRRLQESELRRLLSERQSQVLRLQLQPHFLFNTLQTVSALAEHDPHKAQSLLAQLSDLLRFALNESADQCVSLATELDFVRTYLEIEKARFGERQRMEWAVDPETLTALVPKMLLQPVVENAIRHGISRRAGGGTIFLAARTSNQKLRLMVEDSSPGPRTSNGKSSGFGIGLRNTEERLRCLYGEDYAMRLQLLEQGAVVEFEIPFSSVAAPMNEQAVLHG